MPLRGALWITGVRDHAYVFDQKWLLLGSFFFTFAFGFFLFRFTFTGLLVFLTCSLIYERIVKKHHPFLTDMTA